jgi:hypothetical protein
MPMHIQRYRGDMLICMRTTILLPDELYQRVRMTAAAEQRTITSVIEEALRAALRERERREPRKPYRIDPIVGGELQPGVDLDNTSALLDLMDGLTDADART